MQVVLAPNPILREKAKLVKKTTPELLKTVREMVKLTESFKDPEGVGLAAPQVGLSRAFFIAKLGKKFELFVNPKILSFGKKQMKFLEGCLSIPDYYGEIKRPTIIKVSYQNEKGQTVNRTLKGTPSMIFQHEYDHLHGQLFMDLVLSQHARLLKVVGRDKAGAEVFEEVAL